MGSISESAYKALLPRQNNAPSLAPPGVVPNYDNPESISDQVTISSIVLIVLTTIFVGIRVLVKWRVVQKWGLDDRGSNASLILWLLEADLLLQFSLFLPL